MKLLRNRRKPPARGHALGLGLLYLLALGTNLPRGGAQRQRETPRAAGEDDGRRRQASKASRTVRRCSRDCCSDDAPPWGAAAAACAGGGTSERRRFARGASLSESEDSSSSGAAELPVPRTTRGVGVSASTSIAAARDAIVGHCGHGVQCALASQRCAAMPRQLRAVDALIERNNAASSDLERGRCARWGHVAASGRKTLAAQYRVVLRRLAAATTPKRRRQEANTNKIGGGATLRRRGQTNHREARSNAVCNNARSSRAKSSPPKTFS